MKLWLWGQKKVDIGHEDDNEDDDEVADHDAVVVGEKKVNDADLSVLAPVQKSATTYFSSLTSFTNSASSTVCRREGFG